MIKSNILTLSGPKDKSKYLLNKKLLKGLKKEILKTLKRFDGYLIHDCNAFANFYGRDIDALYKKKITFDKSKSNIIIRNIDKDSFRIHLNQYNSKNFLSLDFEKTSSMPTEIEKVFKKYFDKRVYCKYTKVKHLDNKSVIFFKIVKYFYFGTIHSFQQLLNLKKKIEKLDKNEFNLIVKSVNEALPEQEYMIKNFIYWKFNKFYKNSMVKIFFHNLRKKRHQKRKVFSGRLNYKKTIFSKKFVYAFLFGTKAKWDRTHNIMPAITIVGNDGSGKTTLINHIKENFSKMDPLIFDMKASNPFFINISLRNTLKKIINFKFVKNFYILNIILSFIGETLDLFDKYLKYKIGMAWADAGFGLTVFERYPTDRIRGEFPNKKNKFLPFEQFFPFPDGIIYLDVLPKVSIMRKKKDRHTIKEMESKRKNYLSLIKEFNEVEKLSSNSNFNNKIVSAKNYIFKINHKKKREIQNKRELKRVIWRKNFNRFLVGNRLDNSQKEAFFD